MYARVKKIKKIKINIELSDTECIINIKTNKNFTRYYITYM